MKILIIGLGSIAKKHIKALIKINSNTELYALRRENSPPLDNEFKINEIYSNDQIPNDLFFSIISNPTSFHGKAIKALLKIEKPFFIEKPLVHKISHSKELVKILKNKITYVACNLRFHPALIFIKEYLTKKFQKINDVNIYCGSYLPSWRPGADYKDSYSAKPEMGGGVHLDLIHEIDYCYWLFGTPSTSVSFLSNNSHLEIESIDSADYILKYNNFKAKISLNYFRKDLKRTLEILTTEETIFVDLVKCYVKINDEIVFKNKNYNMQESYYKQLNYFINCLKNKKKPMNSVTEAAEVLKICLNNDQP